MYQSFADGYFKDNRRGDYIEGLDKIFILKFSSANALTLHLNEVLPCNIEKAWTNLQLQSLKLIQKPLF